MTTIAESRTLFEKLFKLQADDHGAFSVQDRLALVDELLAQAEQEGLVPISETQMARVSVQDPRVQAIIAGEEVALQNTLVGGEETVQQKMVGMSNQKKFLVLIAVGALMTLLMVVMVLVVGRKAPKATLTSVPATATTLPTSVAATPMAATGLPESSHLVGASEEEAPSSKPNDPISVEFGGVAFVLSRGKVTGDGKWGPVTGEWLGGTELRRVVAVPYSQEVGQAVQGMSYGDEIRLRLKSGEVVTYRLTQIERVKRHQIEYLFSLTPSLAIVLHGERSGDRYVLIAEAVQGCLGSGVCYTPTPASVNGLVASTPTPTPTITPTPTGTSTPVMSFVSPMVSSVIVTDTWSVTNAAAGLRLEVVACSRVAQIGDQKGRFVVCDVTLTAEQDGATYSGQSLAVSEWSLVEKSLDWWPPVVNVTGAFGDGRLGGRGESISGKVAGEVSKGGLGSSSDPVLIWEQSGVRYVIYLEH